ncbi:MAG: AcrB/AcrD/AcrF family protein [Novosphingobium sp.]
MPVVPNYQPGQVGAVRTTSERFQAPSGPGAGGVLAEVAAGAARLADTADRIAEENDQTQARKAASEARVKLAGAFDQYKTLELGAARAGQEGYDTGLKDIASSLLGSATTPRMRAMMEETINPLLADYQRLGASHALTQSRKETATSFTLEQSSIVDVASASDDPAFRDQQGLALRDSVRRQLQFEGYDEKAMPEAYAVAEKAAMSRMHGGVLNRLFASPDPDIDEVGQYLTAYRDEMTSDLYTKTLERMQGPLQERIDDYRADLIDVPPAEGAGPTGPPPGPWQGVAVSVAKRFGLDPSDVGAVMSYETGGTFSPTIMGGTGGQYMGLIQFGPSERKKYGITKTSTPDQWTKAIGDFLEDRGFKRGMGMLDLYSTINAGTPGRYEASDSNGTVRTHVEKILGAHKEKAKGWLGGAAIYDNAPRQWDKAAVFDAIERKAVSEGWSPEAVKRVKSIWTRRMSTDEGLLSEQRRAADEAATTVLANSGDNFRTSMIPRETWNALGPDQKVQFQNIEQQVKKAQAPTANSDTVVALHRMAAGTRSDQVKFSTANLAKYRPFMTPGEYDELATAQARIQQDLRNPKAMDVRGKIDSAIRRAKAWSGIEVDKDASEAFRVRRYMEDRAIEEASRREMSDADYDRLFRDATRTVKTEAWFGLWSGEERSSEVLSPNYRAQIERSFRRANGRDPTEEEVQKAWEAMGQPEG